MAYQQGSTYQTTVNQQTVVVVPIVSGSAAVRGTYDEDLKVPKRVICMCVGGTIAFIVGSIMMILTLLFPEHFYMLMIFGLVIALSGVPFICISVCIIVIYKKTNQSEGNTVPYTEPFIEGRNTSGLSSSAAPSVNAYEPLPNPPTAPPAYNPAFKGAHPVINQPRQSADGAPNTSSSASNFAEMGSEQQKSQPLSDNFTAIAPDSQAAYTEMELALAHVYKEHPANAPPEYSP